MTKNLKLVNVEKNCTEYCNTGNCNTGNQNTGNWNTGNWNTGNCNTGNQNTGDCNTGDYNTGDRNTGDYNTGNWNTGNWNTGNCNTGKQNTGNYNTGNWNTGNCNTGDWNCSSFNNGCFMTVEPKITMFNKPSDWTYEDWIYSGARRLLNQISKNVVEWVYSDDMTDEEKTKHPEHETTGGYLKSLDKSKSAQNWWDSLDDDDRQLIFGIPNFDAEIFKQCTGIDVNKKRQ